MYGERLKTLRKEKNWTLEDIAERLEVAKSTYNGWENEYRKPDIHMLLKIAKLYDVSIDYIVGLTDERDIKHLEYDASEYLKKNNLHWGGVPLSNEELEPICKILEVIARDKISKKDR